MLRRFTAPRANLGTDNLAEQLVFFIFTMICTKVSPIFATVQLKVHAAATGTSYMRDQKEHAADRRHIED
jgi:hypothetical protein